MRRDENGAANAGAGRTSREIARTNKNGWRGLVMGRTAKGPVLWARQIRTRPSL
jgi:hypothetical protein